MKRLLVTIIIMLLTLNPLSQQKQEDIIIEHADKAINQNNVLKLLGDVKIIRGIYTVNCDTALIFRESKIYDLIGNVVVFDDEKTLRTSKIKIDENNKVIMFPNPFFVEDKKGRKLRGASGVYHYVKKEFYAYNTVEFEEKNRWGSSNRLQYFEEKNLIILDKNIEIEDLEQNVKVKGEKASYYRDKEKVIVDKSPEIIYYDENYEDSTTVISEYMEAYLDSSLFIATDNVRFFKKDFAGACDSSVFYRKDERFELYKNPVVRQGNSSLKGDVMHLFLNDNELERVMVIGNAIASTKIDSAIKDFEENKLLGKFITMKISNNQIDTLTSEKNAISYYFIYEEGKNQGASKTTAERISLIFRDGQIKEVQVFNGVQGRFYPPKLIDMLAEEIRNPEKSLNVDVNIFKKKKEKRTRRNIDERFKGRKPPEEIRKKTSRR